MLEQILAWENLCAAWEQVADNRGAPGPDRVSVDRFARNWEANLRRVQMLGATPHYRPGGMRRVAIPKATGGERLLRIANVGDRVLQRAALNVLDDRFEPQFLACSFGYRAGRSLHDAVAHVLFLRDQGFRWVLDADIDDCFASLDHGVLRARLAEAIPDARVLRLLDRWLVAGRSGTDPDRGIALGMPISPLLCNVYLHELDVYLVKRRWRLVRYADDFVVCCRTRAEAERAHAVVERVLARLKLRLEPSKTQITSFDAGFDFLGVHFEGITYSFMWRGQRMSVIGATPAWLWSRMPSGYDG